MPNPPEHDLIMMLMDIVFAEKSTKVLTPFKNEMPDCVPVIRSHLLQLLIEFRYSLSYEVLLNVQYCLVTITSLVTFT